MPCAQHRASDGSEGHCHLRSRRADSTSGEWTTSGGTASQLVMACERLGVAASVERFDEMHEADEFGLSPALVAALERASGDAKARAASRDDGGSSSDCSVCMEPLDASRTLGGFARMATPTIR